MGKFRQFFTELSAHHMSIFLFLNNNLSKYQWIFTKLVVCIDIMEIWFWIANAQILSSFNRVICLQHDIGGFFHFTFLFNFSDQKERAIAQLWLWH